MITISLQPLSFRRSLALISAVLGLSAVSCFGQSAYMNVDSTPYDRQMSRIRSVLFTKGSANQSLSILTVNNWIEDLRAIPYGFSREWKTPNEVESASFADCKGKSVALYQRMRASGAQNVRLVIGRRTPSSRRTHAWLEWTTPTGRFVLDPTINWSASRLEQVGSRNYVPLYAYTGDTKYRAITGGLYAAR